MPSQPKMLYVISYDVTDDRQRTKLVKHLLDYGERVQKSVFEAELTKADVKDIMAIASKYISSADSFRLYPLCKSCVAGLSWLGGQGVLEVEEMKIV